MRACENGQLAAAKVLVEANADINAQDKDGQTALFKASEAGHLDIVNFLLERSSNTNIQDKDTLTALMKAIIVGAVQVALKLVSAMGTQLNLQDKNGETALIKAAQIENSAEIVENLLQRGANPLLHNKEGKAAMKLTKDAVVKALLLDKAVEWELRQLGADCDALEAEATRVLAHEELTATHSDVTARLGAARMRRDFEEMAKLTDQQTALSECLAQQMRISNHAVKNLRKHWEQCITEVNRCGDFVMEFCERNTTALREIGIVQTRLAKIERAFSWQVKSAVVPASYVCGKAVIEDTEPLFRTGISAPSARLLLRGVFYTTDDAGVRYKYKCVIKCASPLSTALGREVEMLRWVAEKSTGSACVQCYFAHPDLQYLVLETHGKDLRALLNADLSNTQVVLEGIATAVKAVHSAGVMHGDIKPQNLLYKYSSLGHCVVKLCDFECASRVATGFGESEHRRAVEIGSKHYQAPELFRAAQAGQEIEASFAIDMFALALVMHQVLRRSLITSLEEKDFSACYASEEDLWLHLQAEAPYDVKLRQMTRFKVAERLTIHELFDFIMTQKGSMLQAETMRQQERERQAVLEREYFTQINARLDTLNTNIEVLLVRAGVKSDAWCADLNAKLCGVTEQLRALKHGLDEVKANQARMAQHVQEMWSQLPAFKNMVCTLVESSPEIPALAVILPVFAKKWSDKLSPMQLVRHKYRLYFLCAHTHLYAPCGKNGEGFTIEVDKKWVRDAAPVLRVGLVLVKLALLASGLPLPVPDLVTSIADGALHAMYVDAVLDMLASPPEDDAANPTIPIMVNPVMRSDHETVKLLGNQVIEGPLALKTIRGVLKGIPDSEIRAKCGLRFVLGSNGKSAWVLDDDATERAWLESQRLH